MKITGLIIILLLITGCSDLENMPRLTKKGVAGYEYCLAHPLEKIYMGKYVFSCGYYLRLHKQDYDFTMESLND